MKLKPLFANFPLSSLNHKSNNNQKLVKELKRDLFSSENQNASNSNNPPVAVPTPRPPGIYLAWP